MNPKLYEEYIFWRKSGFRAVSAYLIAKYGFINYVIDYFGGE